MTTHVRTSRSGGTMEPWGRRGENWDAPVGDVDLRRLERHRTPGRPTHSDPTFLPPGTLLPVLYRNARHAERVIRHDERGMVTWTPSGSDCAVRVPADGSALRSRPAAERFTVPMELRRTPWRGAGIVRAYPTGQPWSVWFFCHEDGTPRDHYINLELPAVIADYHGPTLNSIDLTVDLCLKGDDIYLKDADELAAQVDIISRYTPEDAADIHAIARQARRDLIEPWAWPLNEDWHAWTPSADMDDPCRLDDVFLTL